MTMTLGKVGVAAAAVAARAAAASAERDLARVSVRAAVALSAKDEESNPGFVHYDANQTPVVEADGAARGNPGPASSSSSRSQRISESVSMSRVAMSYDVITTSLERATSRSSAP